MDYDAILKELNRINGCRTACALKVEELRDAESIGDIAEVERTKQEAQFLVGFMDKAISELIDLVS